MPDEPEQINHAYFSTACLHGLHDRCRETCKFCGKPCGCLHHLENSNAEIRHVKWCQRALGG